MVTSTHAGTLCSFNYAMCLYFGAASGLFVHLTMLCVFTLELHIVVNYVILMSEAFCSNLLPLLSTINRFVVIISFICMKHICCFPLGSFGLAHHLTANAI